MYFIVELLYANLLQKWLQFLYVFIFFCFKSRRKMLLIMENHTQKMLLNRNATSLGALLKKCLKACRISWKCKKMLPLEGVANRNRKYLKSHAYFRFYGDFEWWWRLWWRFWRFPWCLRPRFLLCLFLKFVNGAEWCQYCWYSGKFKSLSNKSWFQNALVIVQSSYLPDWHLD